MTTRPSRFFHAALGAPVLGLFVLVVAWWVLIAGAVAATLPSPVRSATTGGLLLLPGHHARIAQRGIRDWPIPTSRVAYDTFQRGVAESDEDTVDDAFAIAEWVGVNYGDAVLVMAIDGAVVEIKLLAGGYAGRHAWLQRRQLTPTD
jgi:hypothetical protein